MIVLLGPALAVAGCQDGYPIAVTRCDRMCDVRHAIECVDYTPSGCVLGCEQGYTAACEPAFDALLTCLEVHRSEIACGTAIDESVPKCSVEYIELERCLGPPHAPNGAE
jgi:hypothetical protein